MVAQPMMVAEFVVVEFVVVGVADDIGSDLWSLPINAPKGFVPVRSV
jgi:hypothetical protein